MHHANATCTFSSQKQVFVYFQDARTHEHMLTNTPTPTHLQPHTRWMNPYWDPAESNSEYVHQMQIGWFVFSSLPLFCCASVFLFRLTQLKRLESKEPVYVTADNQIRPVSKMEHVWYRVYVRHLLLGSPDEAGKVVPYSLRVATCAVVASILVAFAAVVIGVVLAE